MEPKKEQIKGQIPKKAVTPESAKTPVAFRSKLKDRWERAESAVSRTYLLTKEKTKNVFNAVIEHPVAAPIAFPIAVVLVYGLLSFAAPTNAYSQTNEDVKPISTLTANGEFSGDLKSKKNPMDSLYATVNSQGTINYLTEKEFNSILNSLDKSTFTAILDGGNLMVGDASGMKAVTNFGYALKQAGLSENYTAIGKPIPATLDGYKGGYFVDAEQGAVLGFFPGRKEGDRIGLKCVGPILASCVTDGGYFYGASKNGINGVNSSGAFASTFTTVFGQNIELTDSPKIVAGAGNSANLTDKNLFNEEAGVYVIVKFHMNEGKLVYDILAGEKIVSSRN